MLEYVSNNIESTEVETPMAARRARECLREVEGLVAREGEEVTKEKGREKDDRQEDGQHGYDGEEEEQDGGDDGDDGGEGNQGDDSDDGDEDEEDERSVWEEALETRMGQRESRKGVEVEEEEQDGDDDNEDDDDGGDDDDDDDDDGDEVEEGERSVRAEVRETQMCGERHVEGVTGGRTVADYGCRKTVEAVRDKHMCASLWRHGLMRRMTCGMSDSAQLGSATTQFACCCRSRSSNVEARQNSAERLNRGAKPAEVYGFVSSIVVAVAYVVFLVWAYTPEEWLHAIGVTYYPSRYWAIAIPAFVPVAVVFAVSVYLSLCLIHTQPPDSVNTIYDDYSISKQQAAEKQKLAMVEEEREGDTGEELPIPPVCDIPIIEVNDILFGTRSQFHSWDLVPDWYQQRSPLPRGSA